MSQLIYSLVRDKRVLDAFILARFTYRISAPMECQISDEDYEKIQAFCKANGLGEEYLNRTYDDDPIPHALLAEFNLSYLGDVMSQERQELVKYLDEEKSLSIKAYVSYEEAHGYFMNYWEQELVMSLKVNGVNTKSYVPNGEIKLSMSRGRNGEGFDLTDNILKAIPKRLPLLANFPEAKIFAESFVFQRDLQYLKNKYNPTIYNLSRMAAMSMLRVPHEDMDYRLVRVMAFNAEGISDTISGTLDLLMRSGLDVVPHIVIRPCSAPKEFEEFKKWLSALLDEMYHMGGEIPSDGVVVDVNSINFKSEVKNQYSNRNIALKMEYWSYQYYIGEVTAITEEQRRVTRNCKVNIKPMITNDSAQARVINVFNKSILTKNSIRVGSRIYFERNSEAVNILVHGKRLEGIGKYSDGSEDDES